MHQCPHCGESYHGGARYCAACGATLSSDASSSDPLVGRTIGGSFTVQEVLGVGGMGRVYRAEQAMLGRTVAAKVIHPHLLSDDQTVARFYNEARAASRLNHPNSVGIIDFGRTDDGVLYLVMEYIKGKDLATVMHEEGPLPFPRICHILEGVLDALSEAHAIGVVHRDLKPENIILRRFRTGTDLVKVVDFGLATIVGGTDTSITRPGLVCGTPDYMSPEQGRGENVDGRGDLYSLGVVLFELLTERLPYEDETPTKVVMRHITDPVPDPREVAPQRGIPDVLIDVTMRALAKKPDERFESAEEFQRALREVSDSLRPRAPENTVRCASCGADNPSNMRFCGGCGARLTGRVSVPAELRTERTSFVPSMTKGGRSFIDRVNEMRRLRELRESATAHPVAVRVTGEPGAGKTRLLEEIAHELEHEGDLVIWAGPHPSGAPVPYAPVRALIAALFGVEQGELEKLASTSEVIDEPMTRAGLREVIEPTGDHGQPRSTAVAVALVSGIDVALRRTGQSRVVFVVDDLMRCDGLSQQTLRAVSHFATDRAMLLLTVDNAVWGQDETVLEVEGFGFEQARQFVEGEAPQQTSGTGDTMSLPAQSGHRHLLPLYLEQLDALGLSLKGDETLPPRLADVVLQRVERLGLQARRVLQAIAVLGEQCERGEVGAVAGENNMPGLDELRKADLVRIDDGHIRIVHPFIRDLIAASIPAEARKELHQLALGVTSEAGAPLEVRAEHAYRAGEPMSALMLLERMGDVALSRGDAVAGVLAYRRGLELAHREALESGEIGLDRAIVSFSRKLGEGLERSGDVAGADGVLREAMDLTAPESRDRARMLLSLGEVVGRRGRRRDAMRLLGHALEIATQVRDTDTEARVQVALARVRRAEGDGRAAVGAYQRATELLTEEEMERARACLELGEVLDELEDHDAARQWLEDAIETAKRAGAAAIAARGVGTLGRLDEGAGRSEPALQAYEEAAQLAADAGDAEEHAQWRRAAAALT